MRVKKFRNEKSEAEEPREMPLESHVAFRCFCGFDSAGYVNAVALTNEVTGSGQTRRPEINLSKTCQVGCEEKCRSTRRRRGRDTHKHTVGIQFSNSSHVERRWSVCMEGEDVEEEGKNGCARSVALIIIPPRSTKTHSVRQKTSQNHVASHTASSSIKRPFYSGVNVRERKRNEGRIKYPLTTSWLDLRVGSVGRPEIGGDGEQARWLFSSFYFSIRRACSSRSVSQSVSQSLGGIIEDQDKLARRTHTQTFTYKGGGALKIQRMGNPVAGRGAARSYASLARSRRTRLSLRR